MTWDYHDKKLKELKKIYNRISKQTQNRLQEIFNSFQIDFNELYNIADKKRKKTIDNYIDEWEDEELLKGQFGTQARNIRNRTRVKNSEILELLIYSAYIEEQNKVSEHELSIMKEDASYYYSSGIEEVNSTLPSYKRKFHSTFIPEVIFMNFLTIPNALGYIWKDYIESITVYNSGQMYRQTIINIQQGKSLDIYDRVYQDIIKKQQDTRLCINGDKISGAMDLEMIGIDNQAKLEGIKKVDSDAKVRFLAVLDGKETLMCNSLANKEFYIDKENEFDRYYGETEKELRVQRIKCKGLVLGLNLPPINHHFHWCRSTIQYIRN
jgi:hypothetical protein